MRKLLIAAALAFALGPAAAADLPIFDAHLHYSHDAWEMLPPKAAVDLLRKAGIKRALVSSSGDDGQQRMFQLAPDLILPSLRPYRSRGETSSWVRDPTMPAYLEERLKKYRYVAIGEFHLFGADADLPGPRRMVQLARQYKLFLHAHSDVDAVERLFKQWPEAKILWAHSGFDQPAKIREMLKKHRNLWCDLAFRTDHGSGGKPPPEWRTLFLEFPDRFTVGSDSFTPERWHYVPEHARWSRQWLADLPKDVAERIAWKNGEALFGNMLRSQD
jgi:hypothetical protein